MMMRFGSLRSPSLMGSKSVVIFPFRCSDGSFIEALLSASILDSQIVSEGGDVSHWWASAGRESRDKRTWGSRSARTSRRAVPWIENTCGCWRYQQHFVLSAYPLGMARSRADGRRSSQGLERHLQSQARAIVG